MISDTLTGKKYWKRNLYAEYSNVLKLVENELLVNSIPEISSTGKSFIIQTQILDGKYFDKTIVSS